MSKIFSLVGLETNTGIRDIGIMGGIPELEDIQGLSKVHQELVEDCGESEYIAVIIKSFRYGQGLPEPASAEDLGWIIGDTGDGKLHPNDPVTRGEADDMTDKTDPTPATPTPSSPAADTPTQSKPDQPTPTPSEPEKPTPTPTPGDSDSGGSYYYPDAQVRFELPETAHADTEINVMPVWKYTQSFEWSLAKTAADNSEQPVELTDAVTGSLGLEGGTIQFKKDGTYTLTATAKNAGGKETTLSKTVTVYPVLDLTFDLPETTHTDKSVTLAYAPASSGRRKKTAKRLPLTDILDGALGSEGGTFAFKSKGGYTLTAAVTDETGRVFTHMESTKV